jgi:CarD family transcriptional regulator
MYQVGDKVVYPVHGAGVVEAIESREVAGRCRDYYILHLPFSNMRIMIPLDEAGNVGLREPMSIGETEQVLNILESGGKLPKAALEKWNNRLRSQLSKIKAGKPQELAEIVRDLTARENTKPLATGEKKLFEQTKEILFSELWLIRQESKPEIAARIEAVLKSAD